MGKTALIAAITFLIDQFTKWYVVFYLRLVDGREIDVIPPLLNFRMGWNDGINFGLFGNDSEIMRWGLIALAVAISVGVLWYSCQFTGWFAAILFGCVIGGALGNTIDRIVHGAVADFLNMSCCGWQNPSVFNVADIFVFIGAFGFIFFSEKLPKKA